MFFNVNNNRIAKGDESNIFVNTKREKIVTSSPLKISLRNMSVDKSKKILWFLEKWQNKKK